MDDRVLVRHDRAERAEQREEHQHVGPLERHLERVPLEDDPAIRQLTAGMISCRDPGAPAPGRADVRGQEHRRAEHHDHRGP
ncbi:MAG: hypothetical protein H6719_32410 [Sandaracinaceae bacterium]|nr:hypothetical protein [Sandaracinaceae bacterium]